MKNKKEKIKGSIKENISLMSTPLMSILPGQIAFFVILSVIPIASIIAMILSSLSFNYDWVLNFIAHYLPIGIVNILISIFEEQRVSSFDLFFIVMALYVASKATHSVIIASTRIYNGRQRDFIRTRVKAIVMLVVLILFAVTVIGILTIGGRLVYYLSETTGADSFISNTYTILKWPFAFFMVFFTVKLVYTMAPNVSIPSKSVNKGALLTTVIWAISTYAFTFYVTNVANYSKFYGNLSNLIILIIWIYWLSYVFVFGMTFNEYRLTKSNEK